MKPRMFEDPERVNHLRVEEEIEWVRTFRYRLAPISPWFCKGRREFGWGGRIRTFTILINSEVSYRLDHAPAAAVDPDPLRPHECG